MAFLKTTWFLIRRTFAKSLEDRVSRLAAALAYYAVFCIAPLLVIAIRVAALFFGKGKAQKQLSTQLDKLIGKEAAGAIFSLVNKASAPGSGYFIATLFSVALFVYAAIVLFDELQDAMNTIWDVESKPTFSWWRTLQDQLRSLAIAVSTVLLFLITIIISTAMPAATHYVTGSGGVAGRLLDVSASLVIFTLIFAAAYRFLPDAKVSWDDVWIAAVLAGIFFTLGRHLLNAYLLRASGRSIYGATGSVAVILIWVYYSARVFLYGAEFTQVYDHHNTTNSSRKP